MITLATRQSPLALAQAELTRTHLSHHLPGEDLVLLKMVTTGDQRRDWVLSQAGGKGLFTKELELALQESAADLAVHSAKDLPTDLAPGLALAGFLAREDPRDVLVLREGVGQPARLATGSPRRRAQLHARFPGVEWMELRGNVGTRLRKIAEGLADGTVLAAAGLRRLGLASFPGVVFTPLPVTDSVPAPGQAAIALECRAADVPRFAPLLDASTARAVGLERACLRQLGGGCHSAVAAHCDGAVLHFFTEAAGYRALPLPAGWEDQPEETARRLLATLGPTEG